MSVLKSDFDRITKSTEQIDAIPNEDDIAKAEAYLDDTDLTNNISIDVPEIDITAYRALSEIRAKLYKIQREQDHLDFAEINELQLAIEGINLQIEESKKKWWQKLSFPRLHIYS